MVGIRRGKASDGLLQAKTVITIITTSKKIKSLVVIMISTCILCREVSCVSVSYGLLAV